MFGHRAIAAIFLSYPFWGGSSEALHSNVPSPVSLSEKPGSVNFNHPIGPSNSTETSNITSALPLPSPSLRPVDNPTFIPAPPSKIPYLKAKSCNGGKGRNSSKGGKGRESTKSTKSTESEMRSKSKGKGESSGKGKGNFASTNPSISSTNVPTTAPHSPMKTSSWPSPIPTSSPSTTITKKPTLNSFAPTKASSEPPKHTGSPVLSPSIIITKKPTLNSFAPTKASSRPSEHTESPTSSPSITITNKPTLSSSQPSEHTERPSNVASISKRPETTTKSPEVSSRPSINPSSGDALEQGESNDPMTPEKYGMLGHQSLPDDAVMNNLFEYDDNMIQDAHEISCASVKGSQMAVSFVVLGFYFII